MTSRHLKPAPIDAKAFQQERKKGQRAQSKYYDKTARPLSELYEGEHVHFKLDPKTDWKPATVTSRHETPRSYIVQTPDGAEYRRNRRHILKTKPSEENNSTNTDTSASTDQTVENEIQTQPDIEQPQLKVSRYGRVIKPNPKYMHT